ncbi:uncharacterized protein LOC131363755 isoform X2 [Hemibagrus wyckioides]|uniref:uncharacterized protein LOC131363755 isoform X2 n=1 Tax=Hemibagrus wyckioides TaxID=337641 RepID=UPI00266B5D44|nr:uncharacterized protein LOC131363755 isoform X2 [Hemibagrus wyckioides]
MGCPLMLCLATLLFMNTSTTSAAPGSALFPVGPGATQLFLSDGQYQTIQLQQPFKYAGKTYTQFYLSMDGYVAFFVPNINDEVPSRYLGKDVIAPLWTDLDADSGGRWTYEQATSGPLIDQANQEISRTFSYVSFSASWVFVATWENVPLEFSSFLGASLQVVLASDGGDLSFVLMNYGTIPSIPSPYWLAGYDMEYNNFVTIPVNDTTELSSSTNVNIPGRWAFQFTDTSTTTAAPGSALFPVGPGATQLFLSDGQYETIQLQQPFKYAGKTYTQFYLSMDGYVAFFVPNINDEVPSRYLGKDVIAPLWTDLDADSGGRWTYEQATSGPLIDQANQEISRTFSYVSFSASWVFVATWENVPLEFSSFLGASLQVVLASDGGDLSFVLMNYGTIPSIPSPFWLAGYDMEYNNFVTIPVNDTTELSSSTNVNIPGRWAFQFTDTSTTTAAPGSALFPVGPGATQLFLSDGQYETIQLQQPFKYAGKTYTQFYLSMDGYVAFFVPNINDEVPNRYLGKDVIAPLWTDLDADSGGRWTYEQATSGPLIDQANQEISRTFSYVSFSASWVFVATWENVPLEFSSFLGASLQVVLASDGGDLSFVLMNYGTIPSIPSPYWLAGYDMEYNNFVTIPVNDTTELSSSSNVNIPGRWAFQFTDTSTTTAAPGSALFPVGPGATQLFLSDGQYQTIQLQQPFKYAGKTYTQFYLSMDGYVAFFVPNINDEVPSRYLGKDVIAPLWTDLDADSGGRWTYEQATSGPLIDQANQEISRTFSYVSFSASWVFVATWENVPLEFSSFLGASLQVVLASDGGDLSFVLMNYGTIPSIPSPFWLAGYDMEYNNFVTIPVNDTTELSSSSNVNIPGRWAFQFTDTSTTTAAPGSALFPVGPGATQLFLSDGQYQTIQLQQPFKYAGKTYTQFYLSMDGYVAFFVPNINDEVPNRYLGKDVIAPLWTDLDADSGGRWTYEQATSGPLIDQANQEISRTFSYVSFSASWVFVATWENVPLEFSSFLGASLQVALASDGGDLSFVLMNYGTIPSIPSPYWLAGYDMEYNNFVTIPVNDTTELSSSTNVNIPGRWAFQFTASTTTPATTTLAPCQILNCAWDEVCRQINGVYGCACGYITTSSPNIYDAIETCSGSTGSLSLSRCQLFEAGYSADVLHLNDQICKGEIQNNRLVFKFDSNANMCGTTLENNATHIIFKNSVGSPNTTGIISRSGGINITFSCVYPIIQSISMPTDMEAKGGVISKQLSTEGTYQILMKPYTDSSFLVPYSGNVTLEVNHQMYIAVEVDQFDSTQIALVLDNCWATPVNQTDYSVRWDLIINECPNPNDGTVSVLQNGVSTSSHFSFRMFTFTGFSAKIYLHCQVHLCLQKTSNCALPCPLQRSRRRRSVDFYDSAAITMKF